MRLRVLLMLAVVPLTMTSGTVAQPTDSLAKAEAEAEAADEQAAPSRAGASRFHHGPRRHRLFQPEAATARRRRHASRAASW